MFYVSDSCGTELVAIERPQSVSTPQYPYQYRSNLTCTWTITTETNYLVRLDTGHVSNNSCCEQLEVSNFNSSDCRMVKLSASKAAGSGLIPSRVSVVCILVGSALKDGVEN